MLAGSLDLAEFNDCHGLAMVHKSAWRPKGLGFRVKGSPTSLSLSLSTHTHIHAKIQTLKTKDLTTYHQHLSIVDLLRRLQHDTPLAIKVEEVAFCKLSCFHRYPPGRGHFEQSFSPMHGGRTQGMSCAASRM
jgi:hypothetical protein